MSETSNQNPNLNWGTQLCAKLEGQLVPFETLEYTIRGERRQIHATHAHNAGFLRLPKEFSFTIKTWQNQEASKLFLSALLNDTQFSVVLAEYTGTEWTYSSIGFNKCEVDNIRSSGIAADQVPSDVIECKCLEFSVDGVNYGSGGTP